MEERRESAGTVGEVLEVPNICYDGGRLLNPGERRVVVAVELLIKAATQVVPEVQLVNEWGVGVVLGEPT